MLATAAALLAAALPISAPTTAFAAGSVPTNVAGYDISWPQCGSAYPSSPGLAVVGVTGGTPFTGNPCFAGEFQWAAAAGTPQLYVNLQYGQTNSGPLHCSDSDTGCLAYNYGYQSSAWAVAWADQQTGGASGSINTWWLDVETENAWSDDTDQNDYVVQGALDYLQRVAGKSAGVYSTSYQWGEIAGSFAPPGVANWVAGASGLDDAGACAASLWPGGQVAAIQYLNFDINLDQDIGC